MGLTKAFSGALNGTLSDQWKDIITAEDFDEHTVVAPGVLIQMNNGRGSNVKGSSGVVTTGSKIYVPENTAMVIFNQGGIEQIITDPGGYEYQDGEDTVFDENEHKVGSVFNQIKERFEFGGIPREFKRISFINLREIRGIKFGTRGPQMYHDIFYDTDLEVLAYGNISIRVSNPMIFIRQFIPPNTDYYSFSEKTAQNQLISEFLQLFGAILNDLSKDYRISQLPAQSIGIAEKIKDSQINNWEKRFGLTIDSVGIENIQFSEESRDLVRQFSSNKMGIAAYEGISDKAANLAAQQKIANGIQEHGLGDGAGTILGIDMTQNLMKNMNQNTEKQLDINEQIELIQKLKALLDSGILTEDEFNLKKREIMGLS